jgi:hypothetical protein
LDLAQFRSDIVHQSRGPAREIGKASAYASSRADHLSATPRVIDYRREVRVEYRGASVKIIV